MPINPTLQTGKCFIGDTALQDSRRADSDGAERSCVTTFHADADAVETTHRAPATARRLHTRGAARVRHARKWTLSAWLH